MSSQTPYTKFGFDTEFFELVQGQKSAGPAGVAPTKAQAEDMRREAYEEGFAAGVAEGQKQAQADLAQLQQHLQNTLMALQKAQTEREEELVRQALAFLRVSLHHLVGHAAQHYGPELFEHHVRALLPLLTGDEALTLRIHPVARGFHEKLELPQASIMGLPMHVKPDQSLGTTDAVVEWSNGGVEAKLQQHLKAVDELLAGAGAAVLETGVRPDLSPAAATPEPSLPTEPVHSPQHTQGAPQTAEPDATGESSDDIESAAAKAAQDRARQLLGDDDDDLVDALK